MMVDPISVAIVLGAYVWWRVAHRKKPKPPQETQSITIDISTALRRGKGKGPEPMRWSGTVTGPLPIKVLTRPQSGCLRDASYGARIVGVPPSEMYFQQPENTESHATKTVESLAKHGFLADDGKGGYIITDLGLRAHETCSVRQ